VSTYLQRETERPYQLYVWDGDISGLASWLSAYGLVKARRNAVGTYLELDDLTVFYVSPDNTARAWTSTSERTWKVVNVGDALFTKPEKNPAFLVLTAETLAHGYTLLPERGEDE
jgi:hypothetical protein